MTMRERILAVVHGRELDRVPFVIYEGMLPTEELWQELGRERIGFMRWSAIHKEEHPHCRYEIEDYFVGQDRWQRRTLHTPRGAIYEERAFEPVYNSSSVRKHYIEKPEDYEVFWAYLEDCVLLEDYDRFRQDQAELGDDGTPLVAIERTPYQQLWIIWVGLDNLANHYADCPDRVEHTIGLLRARERRLMELAARSPATFIDFPDNITAPAIGPRRFRDTCVPLYDELADQLAGRGGVVFVHMDGDLKALWPLIAQSKVGGIDSLAPTPDNDTSVADAVRLWPDKRYFVNFPSSVHLRDHAGVREEAERILAAGGHTGRLQIQVSENVPLFAWRTSFPAILDAVEAFGKP
jgi:hypothetical protein